MALDSIQRAGLLPGYQAPGYDPAYGGVPGVPSPTSTASTAIGGNVGNLASLYGLGTGAGRAAGAGAIAGLGEEIPGVTGSIGAETGNINQLLSGQVPADVIAQLAQQSAEIGAGRGMGPMAPSTNAGYLRALGLTSLGMKSQGAQELHSLMGAVPRAPAFDPSSMLVQPRDQQEAQYLAEVLRNAPQPAAAARANLAALQAGTGVSGYGGTGGYSSRPPIGGPGFSTPMLTPDPTGGNFTAYGPAGGGDEISDPTAWWKNLSRSWATEPGRAPMSQEDIYNLGLTPAIEDNTIQDPEPRGPMDAGYVNEEDWYNN